MSSGGYSYGMCTCKHGYGCACRRNDGYNFTNSVYNTQLPDNSLTVSTGLTFADLPSVTVNIGPIERKFPPVRRYLSPSNFETIRSWSEIQHAITTNLGEKHIAFYLPEDEAIFYVKGVPNDKNLNFDIYCCHRESYTFIIEFRCVGRGNIDIFFSIFEDIRNLLVKNEEELDE
jgi:hypothetical protein